MRRGITAGAALALAGAGAAVWVMQHRRASRASASDADIEAEGLTLPEDIEHRFVDTDDGARIHVVERGRGPAIVLLHGFMLDSSIWSAQFRDLSEHRRVVAVDLRGHGRSEPGRDGFTWHGADSDRSAPSLGEVAETARAGAGAPAMHRLAADIAAVLEQLDLSDALLVGHSMGGMVALQLVRDRTALVDERVSGLALVSTAAGPFFGAPGWAEAARLAAPISARSLLLAERVGARATPSRDARYWISRVGFGADATPAQVRFVESLHMAASARTLTGLLPSLAVFDLSSSLAQIELAALVVVGSHDHLTPSRLARRMANALGRSQLVELPRCGHMPMIERPHEFSHLLEEFAAKTASR